MSTPHRSSKEPSTPAPGAYRPCNDTRASFSECVKTVGDDAWFLVDERVMKLHSHVRKALSGRNHVSLKAGEQCKTLQQLQKLSALLPAQCSAVVAVGGGTVGDLATVLAHLSRRGIPLIHVPTTLLAAVDSSVGGKGAVHVRSQKVWIKNAWGVFHYPVRSWICEELWTTLDETQVRQGAIEALKMDVCLVKNGLKRWSQGLPADMVEHSRTVKDQMCRKDPYDSLGPRKILNFGHTFGHAYESLTRFRLAHGDAVALGMLQALEIGVMLDITPTSVAQEIEEILFALGAPTRHDLEALTRRHGDKSIFRTIAFDKKGANQNGANMVLLSGIGTTRTQWVEWKSL